LAKGKSKTSTKKSSSAKKKTAKKKVVKPLTKKKKLKAKLKKKMIKAKVIKKKVSDGTPKPKKKVREIITIEAVRIEMPKERKLKRYKPNKKVKFSVSELKHFRNIILQERKAILESAKANMDALVDKDSGEYKGDNLTYSSHMAEQGTDEMEREKNYLFVQRDEKYLGYLQDALMRIDQGTYGICVDCRDNPKNLCRTCPLIVKERLELVPITQHCIECKNLRG
jgi:RNA polymerase-binding transcription factor